MSHVSKELPVVYLARHGETAWSLTGQHTGHTDLPLTEVGENNARKLRSVLRGLRFARVFSSPLRRALRTCELAGFKASAEILHDLVEWQQRIYALFPSAEIFGYVPDGAGTRFGCVGAV